MGNSTLTFSTVGVGSVLLQRTSSTDANYISTTSVIPGDNTIPQNTEGSEYTALNTTITPSNSSNVLVIEFTAFGDGSTENVIALFQDSTANALQAGYFLRSSEDGTIYMRHIMVAGTTSATTFKIRYGPHTAGTTYLGGTTTGSLYGTAKQASLTITEYKA